MKKFTISKRAAASLLLCVLLGSSICSCSEKAAEAETSGTNSPVETTLADSETETAADEEYAALEVKDLGGKTVNVLIRTEWLYEFKVDQENGDVVNDSVYSRNRAVSDNYNVSLNFIDISGDWSHKDSFINTVHNSVLAGDGAYDFIAGYQAYMVQNAVNGDFLNLLSLPYLELDGSWWTKKGVDALTINDRCYLATGDIALTMLENLYCMFYNKNLAENYDVSEIYSYVDSGEWTHDKFVEVCADITTDVNGDGSYTDADLYGIGSGGNYLREYLVAYDTPVMSVGDDGVPYLSWYNDRTVSVVEKLVDFYSKSGSAYLTTDIAALTNMFRNGQAMIITSTFGQAASLRSMDDDFGIIPYPKLNDNQDSYYTSTGNNVSMVCVPITSPSPEDTALIIEALCRESTGTITQAFYETALKSKYARDDYSEKMIDLIRGSLTFDFGWVNSVIINLGNSYQMFIENGDTDFASYYASREAEYTENLAKITDAYFGE